MSETKNRTILEDIFEVLEVDPDGKKFDKGACLARPITTCTESDGELECTS